MITPFDDFVYLVNNVLLGEEPVSYMENECFMFLKYIFVDHRRFHSTHRYSRSVRGICAVVLLSCCAQGIAGTLAL